MAPARLVMLWNVRKDSRLIVFSSDFDVPDFR